MLVSLPFRNSELCTGPLAETCRGLGDIGNYVGAAAAVVLYLLTYRLPYLWHRRPTRTSTTSEEPLPR